MPGHSDDMASPTSCGSAMINGLDFCMNQLAYPKHVDLYIARRNTESFGDFGAGLVEKFRLFETEPDTLGNAAADFGTGQAENFLLGNPVQKLLEFFHRQIYTTFVSHDSGWFRNRWINQPIVLHSLKPLMIRDSF